MTEPVQAQAMDSRAGLGSQLKKLDPSLAVQAGDSYKTVIHKKALARFREMSQVDRYAVIKNQKLKRSGNCLCL